MTAASGPDAIANAEAYTTYASGMCLQFVRMIAWEIGGLYGSAIDAWDGARYKHPGDRKPPVGAPCFYRGGTYGHIVVAQRSAGRMRSTDCTSATRVNNADLSWPENSWGQDYLGWTEDLNGVRLPLGNDEPEDDMPDYGKARHTKATKLTDGNWYPIDWGTVDSGDDCFDDDGGPGIRAGGSRYQASLAVHITDRGSASVQTSWVEMADAEAVETSPTANHGDVGQAVDARVGRVPDGRKLRARVRVVGGNATLDNAQIDVLLFRAS
jgi:hypothetical protein